MLTFVCVCTVLTRVKSNAQRRRDAKEKGESVQLKRQPVGPRAACTVELTEVESLAPQPYDTHI
jgi:large subunit ribosomal protein L21e